MVKVVESEGEQMNLPKKEAQLEYSPKIAPHNRSMLAFAIAVPIGILGGLIGLGGAEFRLPVLAGPLKYSAQRAVPLNLAISLVTLAVSLVIRGRTLSFTPLSPYVPAIGSLIAGAVITAFIGATLASRLSKQQFERIILICSNEDAF